MRGKAKTTCYRSHSLRRHNPGQVRRVFSQPCGKPAGTPSKRFEVYSGSPEIEIADGTLRVRHDAKTPHQCHVHFTPHPPACLRRVAASGVTAVTRGAGGWRTKSRIKDAVKASRRRVYLGRCLSHRCGTGFVNTSFDVAKINAMWPKGTWKDREGVKPWMKRRSKQSLAS
jgi:hypothetical protein